MEIKTAKKGLSFKAVYIKHPKKKLKWSFYIYYYNKASHAFYINGLNKKTISETTLEEIINRAFQKEERKKKKPTIFYFSEYDWIIYIDKVKLKTLVKWDWEIVQLFIDNSKLYS